MTQQQILDFLKQNKSYMESNFGVQKIGLFGSYARNDYKNDSDIDLFVDLKEQKYDFWVSLKIYLEKAFDKKVDVITNGKFIRKSFLDTVKKDIIYV